MMKHRHRVFASFKDENFKFTLVKRRLQAWLYMRKHSDRYFEIMRSEE